MAGIKIINVLRHDTLEDIMEVFRAAPSGEVIFVLPKNGKVLRTEDHFAAFAAEAAANGKNVSILTGDYAIATLARKHKFTVMPAGKPVAVRPSKSAKPAKVPATLASQPPPAADDIQDTSEDAFDRDSRVVGTSDETMGTDTPVDEEKEELDGFHVEDHEGPVDLDENSDEERDEPKNEDLQYGNDADLTAAKPTGVSDMLASLAAVGRRPVPVPPAPPQGPAVLARGNADLDYIDSVWRDRNGVPPAPRPAPRWNRTTPAVRRIAVGILVVIVVAAGVAAVFSKGSAIITLTPQSAPVRMDVKVQASDAFGQVDEPFGRIPGQRITVSKSATASHDASGTRDVASKARGRITVHNEYSSSPQTLVATTRFADESGKIFRTIATVTVPGSTVVAGKPVAGTAEVEVIAAEPGPDYNGSSGRFTVVAFTEKGDAERAARIYGVLDEATSGGASGPSKVVTQADYDAAKNDAVAAAKEQLAQVLADGQEGMTLPEGQEPEITIAADARPEDAADKVTVTATATLETVGFLQEDLDELIRRAVKNAEGLGVQSSALTVATDGLSFNSDTGTLTFTAVVSGTGYEPVDTAGLIATIIGKKEAEVARELSELPGVQSATLRVKPFWSRSVPADPDKITLRLTEGPQAQATPSP